MVMSTTITLAAPGDRRFLIPDRPGHLSGHPRRQPCRRAAPEYAVASGLPRCEDEPVRMHADQADITAGTVTRLVASQFPRWRQLPVRAVASGGTVNALFRLGDDIILRFPLQPSLDPGLRDDLARNQDIARRIAAHVPVPVPQPVAFGEPGEGYPGPWTAYRWIPGETATNASVGDSDAFARDLAGFVTALHGMDTGGRSWPGHGRGGPLAARDEAVRRALADSAQLTDTAAIAGKWPRCRYAARRDTADVWIHADLMPGNLLVRGGRLAGVIDLEGACVGDPAVDLMPAWNLMAPRARETYRHALAVDDATWERGRGWAIVQAIVALPYYAETNPVMADTARFTLEAVLG
jgi:aminoglycoside phosphotransferase (APT) family kinase protein